jgi:hypothetical protein
VSEPPTPPPKTAILQHARESGRQVVAARREVLRAQEYPAYPFNRTTVMPAVVSGDRSIYPPMPLMNRAVAPVLESKKMTALLLVKVALPAVLKLLNPIAPLLVKIALPAVLWSKKLIVLFWRLKVALPAVLTLLKTMMPPSPLFMMVALPLLMRMPAPLKMINCSLVNV